MHEIGSMKSPNFSKHKDAMTSWKPCEGTANLESNSVFKSAEADNQAKVRIVTTKVFSVLNFIHSFKSKTIQPINLLYLAPFILVYKPLQTFYLTTLMFGNLLICRHLKRWMTIDAKSLWIKKYPTYNLIITFPGVEVGIAPSASFPGQSRSFCLPDFSCFLLLNR